MRFKNLEGIPEGESPKRTIFADSRLGLLQMISEPDIGGCASEEVELQRGGGHKTICQQGHWAPKGTSDSEYAEYAGEGNK